MPPETLKLTLQQSTSEVLKKILARSDSMNQLRQIIDLRNRKVKQKNYDSQIFVQLIEKEQQRIQQENVMIAKLVLKIDDKVLIKNLQKMVKKMLKPFKGFQFDDFLHNEIHLNEIMTREDDQKDPIKESRKRHLRILDAALKEQVVDTQVVLCICVQISRQSFFNELQEYFNCAYEYLVANQKEFLPQDIQLIYQLKQRIQKMKPYLKVSIQHNKKLDKMFYLLLEQNQEVHRQIFNYKEKYEKSQEQQITPAQQQQLLKATKVATNVDPNSSNTSACTQTSIHNQFQTHSQQVRSSSNTGITQQSYGAVSSNILSTSRQSIQQHTMQQQVAQRQGNRNNLSAQNQQNQQPRTSVQKTESVGFSRRRIVSRANISQGNQDVFNSRDTRQLETNQKLSEEVTPPRSLVSQNQQRIKNQEVQHQSLVISETQNRYQNKAKQLQPLVLNKVPKTVVNTSTKAQAIGNEDRYQQQNGGGEQFNIINSKKKRTIRNRRLLEPLTEQKPLEIMNKTEQGFLKMSQNKFQQGKLLPISNSDNQPKIEDAEEFCQCSDPVAKKEVRQSAEFKMRILSKKKTVLKNQHRLVCETCGSTIRHTLHGSHSLTTVQKDKSKRSTYQIDSDKDNLDIPGFNINLGKEKVGLNFDQNQENEDDLGYGGNTARLRNSSQSSVSSQKSSSKSSEKVRNNARVSSESSQDESILQEVGHLINQKYIKRLSQSILVQNFIVRNRIVKIQRFYSLRHQVRIKAAKLISKRVKIFLSQRGEVHLRKSNLAVQRRRSAINRIAEMYQSLKAKKVAAQMVINSKHLYDQLQQVLTSEKALSFIKAIVTIQNRWRIKHQKKFNKGRQIVKSYRAKKRLFQITMEKYKHSQNSECELLQSEIMFAREARNLEQYFFKQQFLYMHDLDQRAQMIAFRTQRDFQQSDWSFNSNAREWTSASGILKFALEKNDQPTFQVLKEKVVQFYVTSQSPTIGFVSQHLQALTNSKNALQTLQERERQHFYAKIVQEIKRRRFAKIGL